MNMYSFLQHQSITTPNELIKMFIYEYVYKRKLIPIEHVKHKHGGEGYTDERIYLFHNIYTKSRNDKKNQLNYKGKYYKYFKSFINTMLYFSLFKLIQSFEKVDIYTDLSNIDWPINDIWNIPNRAYTVTPILNADYILLDHASFPCYLDPRYFNVIYLENHDFKQLNVDACYRERLEQITNENSDDIITELNFYEGMHFKKAISIEKGKITQHDFK